MFILWNLRIQFCSCLYRFRGGCSTPQPLCCDPKVGPLFSMRGSFKNLMTSKYENDFLTSCLHGVSAVRSIFDNKTDYEMHCIAKYNILQIWCHYKNPNDNSTAYFSQVFLSSHRPYFNIDRSCRFFLPPPPHLSLFSCFPFNPSFLSLFSPPPPLLLFSCFPFNPL